MVQVQEIKHKLEIRFLFLIESKTENRTQSFTFMPVDLNLVENLKEEIRLNVPHQSVDSFLFPEFLAS